MCVMNLGSYWIFFLCVLVLLLVVVAVIVVVDYYCCLLLNCCCTGWDGCLCNFVQKCGVCSGYVFV